MEELDLIEIIERVMENDNEALVFMHKKFRNLLFKYASFLSMNIDEIISEFDLIIMSIYKAGITEDKKILTYIKTAFKNLKNKNKREVSKLFFEDLKNDLDTHIYFLDIIKDCNKEMKILLKLRFVDQYNYEEIGNMYGITRQCVHKKIRRELNKLKEVI